MNAVKDSFKLKKPLTVNEIQTTVAVLFKNAKRIQNIGEVPDDVFFKMAQSTGGKRTVDEAKRWYFTVKNIREHEKRWTVRVLRALTSNQGQKFHDIMFIRGPQLGDRLAGMTLDLGKEEEYEEPMEVEKENSMDGRPANCSSTSGKAGYLNFGAKKEESLQSTAAPPKESDF